jgi:hypothetical protein
LCGSGGVQSVGASVCGVGASLYQLLLLQLVDQSGRGNRLDPHRFGQLDLA